MGGVGTIPMKKRTSLLILLIFLNLLLVVASWTITFYYYPQLPEEVPTHYGLHGPPDSWGDKSTILFVPAVQTGLAALLLVVSLLMMRYPRVCNFPVDLKTLSDGGRDELYSLTSDSLSATGIIVNLLFFYIVLTNINVALGIWSGINGYVLALVICSIAGASLYYVTRMMGLR